MDVLAESVVNFFYDLLYIFEFWFSKVQNLYFSDEGISLFGLIAIAFVIIVLFVALLNFIRALIQLR